MTHAKKGDKVTVHYTGKLKDGSIFDTTSGEKPLEFKLGEGDIIDGFEEAVLGMSLNEKKSVTLPPEKAYGIYNKELVFEVPLDDLPPDFEIEIGDELEIASSEDEPVLVIVASLNKDSVTFDGNAPLVGEQLQFDLELVNIESVKQ